LYEYASIEYVISDVYCIGCPDGFTYSSSAKGCYKVSPQKAYALAGAECQTLDARAHLAIITSQAEMDAIDALITTGQCYLMLYFGLSRYNNVVRSSFNKTGTRKGVS